MHISNIRCLNNVIHVVADGNDTNRTWNMIVVYGTPYFAEKNVFWENLEFFVENLQGAWLIIGDLNEIVDKVEKQRGHPIEKKKLFLKPFLSSIGGVDLDFIGKPFTWSNGREGLALIRQRLDRAFANHLWLDKFPKALVEHLTAESSDHCSIILRMDEELLAQTSFQVVKDAWEEDWKDGMEWHKLRKSLFNTYKPLKKWNMEKFGFAQYQIKDLEKELDTIQFTSTNNHSKEA